MQERYTSYHLDSAQVKPGGAFFAIRGRRVDGHDFLEEVAKRGGVCAVVSQTYSGPDFGLKLHRVDSVTLALQELAKEWVLAHDPLIVGITGTYGKTSIKEFAKSLISPHTSVYATSGNANSQLGLPLTILNDYRGESLMLVEMGVSEPGNMERLVEIVSPHIAVLSKIDHGHTEFFGSIQAIAEEKSKILLSVNIQKALIHKDNLRFEVVQNRLPEHTEFLQMDRYDPSLFSLTSKSHLINASFAAHLAEMLGYPLTHMQSLKPFGMRHEQLEIDGVTYIKDCYNALPGAVEAALTDLPKPRPGHQRIAILGSMLELGEFSQEMHERVAEIGALHCDLFLCIGEECQHTVRRLSKLQKPAFLYDSIEEIAQHLHKVACPGDVVLVKGSKRFRLWELFDHHLASASI